MGTCFQNAEIFLWFRICVLDMIGSCSCLDKTEIVFV